jgi:hypothetical protein
MYTKLLISLCLILSFHAHAQVSIKAIHQSEDELKIKHDLESLQTTFDLSQWIYTNEVIVDEKARTPRSHPVLTMSTQEEYLNSNIKLLSTFLHEQLHWHIIENGKASKEDFRNEIKAVFPNVMYEHPFGSGTEGGTLSHIIVCYLEYLALAALVGDEKAAYTLSTNEYYIWVYKTILNPENHFKLDGLIQRFGLGFQ